MNAAASTPRHPVYGWNFVANNGNVQDKNGHGTHVTGVIAATGNNGQGVAGIDWHAQIMPLKILDSTGSGSLSSAVTAVYFAAQHGARVINASWGSSAPTRRSLTRSGSPTRKGSSSSTPRATTVSATT